MQCRFSATGAPDLFLYNRSKAVIIKYCPAPSLIQQALTSRRMENGVLISRAFNQQDRSGRLRADWSRYRTEFRASIAAYDIYVVVVDILEAALEKGRQKYSRSWIRLARLQAQT